MGSRTGDSGEGCQKNLEHSQLTMRGFAWWRETRETRRAHCDKMLSGSFWLLGDATSRWNDCQKLRGSNAPQEESAQQKKARDCSLPSCSNLQANLEATPQLRAIDRRPDACGIVVQHRKSLGVENGLHVTGAAGCKPAAGASQHRAAAIGST